MINRLLLTIALASALSTMVASPASAAKNAKEAYEQAVAFREAQDWDPAMESILEAYRLSKKLSSKLQCVYADEFVRIRLEQLYQRSTHHEAALKSGLGAEFYGICEAEIRTLTQIEEQKEKLDDLAYTVGTLRDANWWIALSEHSLREWFNRALDLMVEENFVAAFLILNNCVVLADANLTSTASVADVLVDARERFEQCRNKLSAEELSSIETLKDAARMRGTNDERAPAGKAAPAGSDRFVQLEGGTILDRETRQEWLVGPDYNMSYFSARKWLLETANKGGLQGWRMPTRDELKKLYRKNDCESALRADPSRFSREGFKSCNLDALFQTSGDNVWAEDRSMPTAWTYYFLMNRPHHAPKDFSSGYRVFAVRTYNG